MSFSGPSLSLSQVALLDFDDVNPVCLQVSLYLEFLLHQFENRGSRKNFLCPWAQKFGVEEQHHFDSWFPRDGRLPSGLRHLLSLQFVVDSRHYDPPAHHGLGGYASSCLGWLFAVAPDHRETQHPQLNEQPVLEAKHCDGIADFRQHGVQPSCFNLL